jgi:excisionase family DNA binding protein
VDLLTIPEVAKELRISRSLAYQLLLTEGLPFVGIGRRKFVRRPDLEVWLESRRMVLGGKG